MKDFNYSALLFGLAAIAIAAIAVTLGYDPVGVAIGSGGGVAAMAVVQSAYSETISAAYAGMVANERNWDADTRVCETSAGIAFGVAVGRGTADNGCVIGGAAVTDFLGITVRDVTLVTQAGQTVDKYQQYDNVAVLTQGDIWVAVGAAVVDGDNVTFNSTTGVLSSAATSGTQFLVTGACWMTTQATGGGLAIVRLGGALPSA